MLGLRIGVPTNLGLFDSSYVNVVGDTMTGQLSITLAGTGLSVTQDAVMGGYLRVGSTAAPTNTTAGDLTAVRIFSGTTQVEFSIDGSGNLDSDGWGRFDGQFDETTTITGVYLGRVVSDNTPRFLFANGTAAQNWQIDNSGGNFRWYLPGVVKMLLTSTGLRNSGWLRVGSAAGNPANTTAGDLTALRLAIGDSAFTGNNKIQQSSGSIQLTSTQTVASGASVTLSALNLVASTITISGSTNITTAAGFNLINIGIPTYSNATIAVTNAATLYIAGSPAVTGGMTLTNAYTVWIDSGVSRFDGRLLFAQGADVASANNLTLGTDGNTFEITGTTQINLIDNTNWQNGSIIHLLFTSTPTVKDAQATSGANITILLSGSVDFVASADDVLTLVLSEIGGTQAWREISRSTN